MTDPLPHYAEKARQRLLTSGVILCRQVRDTEEALERGGGFLYFTHPSGKSFPTKSGQLLIELGEVQPRGDGLFSDIGQTFEIRR